MIKGLEILALAVLAAMFYRLGGTDKSGKWYGFLCNTKTRDIGVPVCSTAAIILLTVNQPIVSDHPIKYALALFLSFGLLFGSLTTYWKKKGTDAKWYNWMLTGIGYGVSYLPIALFFVDWWGFGIRVCVLAALITGWSVIIGKDWLEESGRGFLIILTIPLLLIGLKKKEK